MNTLLGALVGLAGLAACAAAPGGDAVPPPSAARIGVERTGDLFLLTALHEGPAGPALRYSLRVVREGAAGRSQSAQSGTFTPTGAAIDTLSSMRVNAQPGDLLEAVLTLHRGETVVATDTFAQTVPPAP